MLSRIKRIMKVNMYLCCALVFISNLANAQEITIDNHKDELRTSMLGYIDTQHSKLSAELDSIRDHVDSDIEGTAEDVIILKRLKSINQTIPLEYNSQVRAYIDRYTSRNYKPYMSRLKGLSNYYFPIYEKILKQQQLPAEIKYVSLIESSLDPHLVSSAGAVGLWQFMYATAKSFNLEMDNHIDERKDPYASSLAMSQYLNEAYEQFGDWLLALASYNCGRGCVKRAIARSGLSQPTFWELANYLPRETRNYIPKFIAITYVMEMASFYDIEASETELNLESKVLMVDRAVEMKHIANAAQVPLEQLKSYNPAYKRNIINGSPERPKRLVLPISENLNDSLLYLAINTNTSPVIESPIAATTYTVQAGETLQDVAKKVNVSVQNLKAWNNLTNNTALAGKTLVLSQEVSPKLIATANSKNLTSKTKSKTVYYTVKKGDSLDRIARKHKNTTVAKLKAENNLRSNLIRPGMRLKIPTT